MNGPHLEAIFIATGAGCPMERVEKVEAIAGRGLSGDRYCEGRGYYSKLDPCEVTLIEAEALESMTAQYGVEVGHGEHRRNLVTRGVHLRDLAGWEFRIGDVHLVYARPRPPCAYLERLTQPRMTRAMGEGAGICALIATGGLLSEGDPFVLVKRHNLPRRIP